jgi:hypothetical protein
MEESQPMTLNHGVDGLIGLLEGEQSGPSSRTLHASCSSRLNQQRTDYSFTFVMYKSQYSYIQ